MNFGREVVDFLLSKNPAPAWISSDLEHYLIPAGWTVTDYSETDPVDDDYMTDEESTNRRTMMQNNGAHMGRVILVTNEKDDRLIRVELPGSEDATFDSLARGEKFTQHEDFGSW